MTRTESRESAFLLLFESMFNPEYSFEDMKEFTEECEIFEIDDFTAGLFAAATGNAERLDEEITPYLKGWKLSRLPKTVLAVLRLSFAQLDFLPDVPTSVVANEAVELTKKYATEKDAAFVNGLLGAAIRDRAEK